jgi:hypothetical protein
MYRQDRHLTGKLPSRICVQTTVPLLIVLLIALAPTMAAEQAVLPEAHDGPLTPYALVVGAVGGLAAAGRVGLKLLRRWSGQCLA